MGESRGEDILENILGEDNELENPQSRVEEILWSILFGTEYTDEAKSRMEDLLLRFANDNAHYSETDVETGEDYILIPPGYWQHGVKLIFTENWEWSPFNFNRDIIITSE